MGKLKTYATHFASIGGACWGMEKAGLRCVSALEREQARLNTREKNIGHKGTCMDIGEYVPSKKEKADILWTSPPCTRLSSASRQYVDLDDPMNLLYLRSVEYCKKLRPKYFVLENVMGILTHKVDKIGNNTLMRWKQDFEAIGYHVEWNVLNSKHFGVPQDRERVFMVGSLEGKTGLIPYEPDKVLLKFGDIQEKGSKTECWADHTYRTVLDCIGRNSARNGTPYGFRLVGEGDILPTVTCSFDGGATRKKVGIIDRLDGVTYLRQPTVREGARAQGFPDEWVFPDSRTLAWNFIGDAVTSSVAEAIARHLIALEAGDRPECKTELSAKRIPSCVKSLHNDSLDKVESESASVESLMHEEDVQFDNL